MDIGVRVRKGVGSALVRGMLAFVTLGIGVDSTSGQGLMARPHELAACHAELRTLYDHDQASRAPGYFVEQIFLGGRIVSNTSAYQRYRCSPSEQFENFTWCTKTCSGSDTLQRGNFQATYSLLHAKDGSVAYVNRFQKPVYWAMNEINEDIQKLSQKLGSQPKISRLPTRDGLARAVLATWGKVRLEHLDFSRAPKCPPRDGGAPYGLIRPVC